MTTSETILKELILKGHVSKIRELLENQKISLNFAKSCQNIDGLEPSDLRISGPLEHILCGENLLPSVYLKINILGCLCFSKASNNDLASSEWSFCKILKYSD